MMICHRGAAPLEPSAELDERELFAALDTELAQLPDKFRAPLVLCYLEGKTNEQASEELGWPIGSMSKRLAAGRELLRRRIVRRGVALSAAALTTALAEHAAAATVPTPLLGATVRAATLFAAGDAGAATPYAFTLAEKVSQAMSWTRMRNIAAALLLTGSLLAGFGLAAFAFQAADRAQVALPPLIRSAQSGAWSAPATWEGGKVPNAGCRVQVRTGHRVVYDVRSDQIMRSVHVAGTLSFADDQDTRLAVGLIKIQPGDENCSEEGFDCEAHVLPLGPGESRPALEVGTPDRPIAARHTALIRLVCIDGMDKDSCPAMVCCGGRMDFHGAALSRTWIKLGKDVAQGEQTVTLAEGVTGWRVGDEVIVTGSIHKGNGYLGRDAPERMETERRRITQMDGTTLTLDQPLKQVHFGSGEFRSEVANLSRNVIVESADPKGIRGHTMYHRHSAGAISYAEFRHLGKEGVLGRYSLHYHLVGETMRGSYVIGASIHDSHNRWLTVHGTNYLVVRDNVGYQSVGHGYFLEDGTEVYNVFDRNLGVQAYLGKPLPKQVLPFDPNDGAAFWWSNGRNSFVRNTACENDRYGFRYDSQKRSTFDSNLRILQPDGSRQIVDIRTLPFYRFEDNETHTEILYGIAVADTDLAAPDTRHPHILKNLKIWQTHYAFRPQVPRMLMENIVIDHAAYGIYRPEYDAHVYRDVTIRHVGAKVISEASREGGHGNGVSIQQGSFTFENLTLENCASKRPLIVLSTTSPKAGQSGHFRNLVVKQCKATGGVFDDTFNGDDAYKKKQHPVAYYLHDHFGPATTTKLVSTHHPEQLKEGNYQAREGFTGEHVRSTDVSATPFPRLLDPVDDLPPATTITYPAIGHVARLAGDGSLVIRGTTTDNVKTRRVRVNGVEARSVDYYFHLWEARLTGLKPGQFVLEAHAEDEAGNVEKTAHRLTVDLK